MNSAGALLVNLTDMTDEELKALRRHAQARIGLNYLMRRPLTRIPVLILKHLLLEGRWDCSAISRRC